MKKTGIIFLLLLLAAIARLAFLGLRPFDGDEGVILLAARAANLGALIGAAARDVQPPLLHILEFFTLKIFPFNEFSARLVPALAGILVIAPIYFVFEKLSNKTTAFWVALASVFSAVLGYHSAELRPYGLFTLIFFCQFYFYLKVLEEKKRSSIFLFSLFTYLLIMTAYIGFIMVLGEFLYVILRKRKAANWTNAISTIAPVVIFGLLWGKTFLNQVVGRAGEQSQALNLKANFSGLINALYRFGAGRLFLDLDLSVSKNIAFLKSSPILFVVFVISVLVPIALIILGLNTLYRKNKEVLYLLILLFAPIILAAAVSSEIGPRCARYLSFMAPFYLFIIINYLLDEKRRIFKFSFAAIFASIYLSSFVNQVYFERDKPGVDVIAEYLRANAQTGDALIIVGGYGGGEELVLRHYLQDTADRLRIYDIYGDYSVGNLDKVKARKPDEFALKAFGESGRVWLYDFTYRVKAEDFAPNSVKTVSFDRDKENKEIILYEITKK